MSEDWTDRLTEEERDILDQAKKPYGSVDERYLRDWLLDSLQSIASLRQEAASSKADANEIFAVNKVRFRQLVASLTNAVILLRRGLRQRQNAEPWRKAVNDFLNTIEMNESLATGEPRNC